MPGFLKECHEEYRDLFSEEWIVNAGSSMQEKEERDHFSQILDFENECFSLLSKSILSGEYIADEGFQNELKLFIKHLEIEQNQDQSNLIKKYYEVSKCLYNALHHYFDFFSYAKGKFITNSSNRRIVFYSNKDFPSDSPVSYFHHTIQVCWYDYKYPLLEYEIEEFISKYINIRELKKKEHNAKILFILNILFVKCNYIIKRIDRNIDFSSLGEYYKISPNSLDLGFLKPTIDKQISFNRLKKAEIEELTNDLGSDNTKLETHIRLSWNMAKRKSLEDVRGMKDLIVDFERKYLPQLQEMQDTEHTPSLKDSHDIFSINSVYNFIKNCLFSIELSHRTFDLSFITGEIERIGELQQGTLIKNFHPFKKSIDTIIGFIKREIDDSNNNKIIPFERALFETLDSFISRFEDYIQWGKNNRFFPFQLTFDESLIHHEGLAIFIPSSFANVIDYQKLNGKLIEYKNQRAILANRYETFKSKLAINELHDQFKKDRFNMLQTIILFAGIITFLFGTINIFSNNSEMDLAQLIINTSGLGIILVLFTSVSMTIAPLMSNMVNANTLMKSKRFWVAIGFALIYGLTIFLNYSVVRDLHQSKNARKLNEMIRQSSSDKISITENDSTYIFRIEK